MALSALELRPRNAVALMDAALRFCTRDAGVWALTLPSGAAVVAAMLYLAESVRMGWMLAPPTLALTLAWFLRGLCQGAACHHVQEVLLGTQGPPSAWASLKAALARLPSLFIAVAYLMGLNTLVLTLTFGLGYLVLSAHGVGYAAVMQGRGSPLRLYGTCSRLLGPARGTAMWVRVLMGAQVLAFFNLHIAFNALLFVGRKLVGVDLTFAERFASLDNAQWLLFLAATTFALFEPVRAVAATLLLVDGRVRQEGLDLLAAVQQLPARNVGRPLASPGASRSAAVLVALLGLGLLVPAVAHADDAPRGLSRAEALKRLDAVAEACEAVTPEDAEHLYAPVEALGPAEGVKLDRFVRRVERQAFDEEDCDKAAGTLLQGLATLGATVDAQSRADARAASARAKDILARPEFAQAAPKAPVEKDAAEATPPREPPGWWRRFVDWLGEKLKALFERDPPAPVEPSKPMVSGASAANVLVVVLVALTLGVLGLLLLRALNRSKQEANGEGVQVSTVDATTLAGATDHALSRPPEGWAHLADELAARGEYRDAVRSLYLALLSRLHRDGAILYDETLSNWDYLRQFRGRAEWKAPFRELTRRFDFAWYGNLPVGVEGYHEFRALTEPLLSAPPRPEVAGA